MGLEGLFQHRIVAVELDTDFVEIVGAAPEGQVLAPVIGVAPQGHVTPDLVILDHVGRRADGHVGQRGLGEVLALPLGLFQDRAQAGDEGQFAVLGVEGQPDAARAGRFDLFDLLPEAAIAPVAFRADGLVRPDHVVDRDGGAVGERGLFAQGEFDPVAVGAGLDRFGQKTVEREGFVIGSPHERLVREVAQLPRRLAFLDERIEAVEAADVAADQPAALGRVGVGIGQGHEIWGQGGVAVHSYAMRRLGNARIGRKTSGRIAIARSARWKNSGPIWATILLRPYLSDQRR